jgi:hypothetical protein
MTWILDVIAVFFVLFFSIYGLVKGSYYLLIDTLLVLVCIAGAGVGAYFTIDLGLIPLGIVDGVGEFWLNVLGASKISGMQDILVQVSFWLSYGLLFLVLFIIYDVILHALREWLLSGMQNLRRASGLVKGVGNFLGFIINLAISAGIVLCLMAFFHSFKESDVLFRSVNEALQSSEILGLVYDVNPLNALFESIGPSIESAFLGFLGK